jgi:hypothetical protein
LAGDGDRTDAEKIGELYLRAYSRRPQPKELEAFRQHLEKFPDNVKHEGYEDVLWAMINTKEFLFNH